MSFFSRDFNSRTRRTNQASIFESLYGSEAGGSETGSQISTQTLPLQYSQLPVTQARKTLSSIGERSGRFDQQYSLNPLSFRRENTEDLEPGSPRVGNVFRSVDLEELDGDDDSQLPPSGDLVLEDIRVDSGEVENVSLRTQKWIEDMSKVDRANTSRKQPDRHRLVRRQQPKLKRQKSGPMPQNPYSFGDILEVTNSDEGHSVGGEEESSNMESKDSTEIAVKITKQLESSEHTGELSDDLPEYLEEDPSRKPEVKIPKVERNVKTGENVKDGFEDLIKWLQVDKTSPESLQVEPLSLSTSDEQTGCSSEKELDTNTDSLPTHSPDGLKKRVKEEAESERRDKTSTSEQMKQKTNGDESVENNEISLGSCDSFVADILSTTFNEKPTHSSAELEKRVNEETDGREEINTSDTMNQKLTNMKVGCEWAENKNITLQSCNSFVADILNTTFNVKDESSAENVTEETDTYASCSEVNTPSVSQDNGTLNCSEQDVVFLEFKKSDIKSSTPTEVIIVGSGKTTTSTKEIPSLTQICQSYMIESGESGLIENTGSGELSSLWAFQVSSLEDQEGSTEPSVVEQIVEPETSSKSGEEEACLEGNTPTDDPIGQVDKQVSCHQEDMTSAGADPGRKRRTDINWSPKSKPEAEKRPRLEGDKLKNGVASDQVTSTRDSSTYTDGGNLYIDGKSEETQTTCALASTNQMVDNSTNTTYLDEMRKKTKLVDGWTQYEKVNSDNSAPDEHIGSVSTADNNDFENIDVKSVLLPRQNSPSDGVRRRSLLNSNVEENDYDDYDDEVRKELDDPPCCCSWRRRAGGIFGSCTIL